MAWGHDSWESAIQAWFDEIQDFTFGVGSKNGKQVGHYTQVPFLNRIESVHNIFSYSWLTFIILLHNFRLLRIPPAESAVVLLIAQVQEGKEEVEPTSVTTPLDKLTPRIHSSLDDHVKHVLISALIISVVRRILIFKIVCQARMDWNIIVYLKEDLSININVMPLQTAEANCATMEEPWTTALAPANVDHCISGTPVKPVRKRTMHTTTTTSSSSSSSSCSLNWLFIILQWTANVLTNQSVGRIFLTDTLTHSAPNTRKTLMSLLERCWLLFLPQESYIHVSLISMTVFS